jgi:protein TonB
VALDSAHYELAVDEQRVSSETDSMGTCQEVLHWQQAGGLLRIFYPSGRLKEYAPYGDMATDRRQGLVTTWFANGQLKTKQTYVQGQRTGELLVYYETGAMKRRTEYVAGKEMLGVCYDPTGQPMAYYPYEQLPLYPGGQEQLIKELMRTLRLPHQLALLASLEPLQVEVVFQVAEDGSIRAPRVARSSRVQVLDQAVLAAIVKLTRRFRPAQRDGQLVACAYYLPVQVKLAVPWEGGQYR